MSISIWRRRIAMAAIVMAGSLGHAAAQQFPVKPMRLVIGFGPGGVTDVVNRIVAQEMGARLGQPVVVENRPGANSLVAAQVIKNAPADGYTMFGGVATLFSPIFLKDNAIVAGKELAPVAGMIAGDWFLYASSSLGVNSIKDLVAWAKANPGKLRFAAPATSNQMLVALIAKRAGFEFENIPYKASDQTIASILSGDTHITLNALSGFPPHMESGKLRAIATLAPERTPLLPGVATVTEQGIPMTLRFNHGIWTTLGTPRDTIARLGAAVNEAMKNPKLLDTVRNAALIPAPMGPDEMLRTFDSQMRFWAEAAGIIGFKPD